MTVVPSRVVMVRRRRWSTVSCQWRKNGVNIPGATNRVTVDTSVYLTRLDLLNVSTVDAATYEVVVTDTTSINLYKVLSAALSIAEEDNPNRRVLVSDM
mgnify:CR=1 FL=1